MRVQLIAIAFVLGCGGSDGVDVSTTQDNVCDEVAEVACHNLYQCCSEGEIEQFLNVSDPRSEGECRDDLRRTCARSIAVFDFGIQQKHIRFDATIMNDCLNAVLAPDQTCATIASVLPWTEACLDSAWVGIVDNGGACLGTFECASKDSVCGANETCTALPDEGKPCGQFGCASGFFCSAGTCHAQLAPGGACASSIQCTKGSFCDFAVAPSVCAELRAPGQACASDAACASNDCIPGTCATTGLSCFSDAGCSGTCPGTGISCTTDATCGTGTCSVGATACFVAGACGGTGVCVFPVQCNLGTCLGDVVCAERHLLVDYCRGALDELPLPLPRPQGG